MTAENAEDKSLISVLSKLVSEAKEILVSFWLFGNGTSTADPTSARIVFTGKPLTVLVFPAIAIALLEEDKLLFWTLVRGSPDNDLVAMVI